MKTLIEKIPVKFRSRKLAFAFLFGVIALANDIYNLGISHQTLTQVAAVVSTYILGNAWQKQAELRLPY